MSLSVTRWGGGTLMAPKAGVTTSILGSHLGEAGAVGREDTSSSSRRTQAWGSGRGWAFLGSPSPHRGELLQRAETLLPGHR